MGTQADEAKKVNKITTEAIPLNKRQLHWKAFFLGAVVILFIEIFAVNVIHSASDAILPTLTPSRIPPTPTNPPALPSNWKTYTDPENGFSLAYPADTYSLDARPQMSTGTLHVTVVKDTDQDATLGADFQPSEYTNLKIALLQGNPYSSLQPGEKDRFQTKTINKQHYVRVYPVSVPGCLCDEIAYITRLPHAFLVLSMATEIKNQTNASSDKETRILQEFGDIEKVLATLTLTNKH